MPSAYPAAQPPSTKKIVLSVALLLVVVYIFMSFNVQEPVNPPTSTQHTGIPQPTKVQPPTKVDNPPPKPQDPQPPKPKEAQPPKPQEPETKPNNQLAPANVACELLDMDMPVKYAEKLTFPPPPTKYRSCKDIAQSLLDQKPPEVKAPNTFPPEMEKNYTLDGAIAVQYTYYKNVYNGEAAKSPVWTVEQVNGIRAQAANKERLPTYPADTMSLYKVLDKWSLETVWEQTGIVVGSETPWVESILLEYGAKHITTIEYGKIESLHPQIATLLPSQSYQLLLHGKWAPVDFAFSYSSIEHSGLGRYGDPLDPFGDLEALQQISCLVKPGGFLFLGFPVGPDCLVFNAHRIYGPRRLELVFKGWHVLDMVVDTAHNADLILDNNSGTKCQHMSQPVIVMQNLRGCDIKA